jgi:hypothetical protein
MRQFLVDSIWQQYNDMPKVNKDEVREQLGPMFEDSFVNKQTRNTDALSPEQLSVWLKLMGGSPIGTLSATDEALLSLQSLHLTKPETAWRAQVFYDTRNSKYPDFYTLQNGYYANETKGARATYLKQNPELKQYWDWRRDFMTKNPDLVPYLTDSQKDIDKAKNRARKQGAVPTAQELGRNLPPDIQEMLQLYSGEALPPALRRELEYLAGQQGLTPEQIGNILQ